MNKILIPIFALILFIPTIAYAQETQADIQQIEVDNPDSILPDSPLYFFDVLFDNIFLGLQTNDVDKAKLAIKIAEERLTELKIMLLEKRFDLIDNIQIEHDRMIAVAEEAVTRINIADARVEAFEKIQIENLVERHIEKVRRVSDDLEIQVNVRGDLTPEQIERIRIALDNIDERVESLSIRIDNEKEETQIKLAEQTGDSEIEIQRDFQILEEQVARQDTEIDVKFVGDMAMVETEIKGRTQFFEVNSLDADTIIKTISDFTGLVEQEIRDSITFEDESRERTLDSIGKLQFLGRG